MIRHFARDERGGMTTWLVVWTIGFVGLAGVAVDITNAFRNKAILQITADVAAHAAIAALIEERPVNEAEAAAVDVAARNLSFAKVPDPVRPEDVEFGLWTFATRSFEPGDPSLATGGSAAAVRVSARMTEATGNPLLTTLLRVVGITSLDVSADSVAVAAQPPCGSNGIIARDWVSLTSNVDFGDKMCLHGQRGLSTKNNITMGEDSLFTTPDTRHVADGGNIDVPSSNYDYILSHARPGVMYPYDAQEERVRKRIHALRTDIRTRAGYKSVTHGNSSKWDIEQDILNGYRYFEVDCVNKSGTFQFPNFKTITGLIDVRIVSTCALKSAGPVYMRDVVIAVDKPMDTEAIFLTGQTEVTTSATDCDLAGDFLAITTGGMKFTADQSYANTRLIASRDLTYTASATTNFNISIQSWQNVQMTSNGSFTHCPSDNPYVLGFEKFPLLVGG
jgi:Flp pilus assembly protein TadG